MKLEDIYLFFKRPQILQEHFSKRKATILILSYFLIIATGIVDTITGFEISLSFLYLIPIVVATWFVGISQGFIICIAASAVELYSDIAAGAFYPHSRFIIFWNIGSKFLIYFALHYLVVYRKYSRILGQKINELARSNNELEQYTAVISHDLKQPLRVIANYLQLLEMRAKGKLDPGVNLLISGAVNEAFKMTKLINELLDYSHLIRNDRQLAWAKLSEVLDQALENIKTAVEDSGAAVAADPLPTLQVVESEMVRVFQNLIDNAIKFREKDPARIHVSAKESGNKWIISVRDNGIGIDSQYFQKIFNIFEKLHPDSKYPGTGLGLSICKKIIENHGGRIWVESEPGKGSTFFFTIPAAPSVGAG